ncbi:MAG: YkgJ family cysteine cluster protein, partial [Myxococcales bacterium]|nr:YkgJ family cysteine cluster protein [Polyangiaceae bacterium]MDW8249311.1 YkgJ family cysteine cluster protein [Myxococcales bacterium]
MVPDSVERLRQLASKVDAFFARVEARYGEAMECRSGCHDCCLPGLTCTGVEAKVLREALRRLPETERERLRARLASSPGDRCVLLDEAGRCIVYEARPMICRSHGIPVRIRDRQGLPLLEACPRNFRTESLAALPASDILDQETLSAMLLAIDTLNARE